MKAQMRFQKIICLVMIIAGALATLYAFCYCSGSLAELGQSFRLEGSVKVSRFTAAPGKNDAFLYDNIQGFNDALMYCGIGMILLGVLLYITACNSRRNYYISNYVATGVCAGGNIVISLILMIMNAMWRAEFLNVDFEAWYQYHVDEELFLGEKITWHYSRSTLWFDIGFAVYAIVIAASLLLVLNLVWKILLMKGEKQLLSNASVGGETV